MWAVAQPNRALRCDRRCCGFKSRRPTQNRVARQRKQGLSHLMLNQKIKGVVAQRAERTVVNREVASSSLVDPAISASVA